MYVSKNNHLTQNYINQNLLGYMDISHYVLSFFF